MFFKHKQDIQILGLAKFSLTSLRNMANFMATIDPILGAEFFKHFKVSPTENLAHNKLSDKIFNELKRLILSTTLTERALLEELIVKATNPAFYQYENFSKKEILEKFNEWLKDTDLIFVDFNNSIHLIRKGFTNNDYLLGWDHKDIEKEFVLSVNKNNNLLVRIAEIKYTYKILIEIINISAIAHKKVLP